MTSTLTATQLRNARKRRSLKRTKRESLSQPKASEKSRKRPTRSGQAVDPSQQYIANPYAAPTVKAARKFFQAIWAENEISGKTRSEQRTLPIHLGPRDGWRTVVKLPVRGVDPPRIGLFSPGSHRILPVISPDNGQCICSTHHPVINRAMEIVQQVLDRRLVTAYSEQTGQGLLRHVAFSLERHTLRVQLVLVWNDGPPPSCKNSDILHTFWQSLVSQTGTDSTSIKWHSIWVHYNNLSKHTNAIYNVDGAWETLYSTPQDEIQEGETSHKPQGVTEYIGTEVDTLSSSTDLLPRIPLHFPPQVFRQGNLTAFTNIVQSIRRYCISSGLRCNKCLELYGGVGTIGLHLVDLCDHFIGSDENPYNVACFEASARSLQNSKGTKVRYISASASEMVLERQEHRSADVIIVDPPRKGLDPAMCRAMVGSAKPEDGPQTLIYVSCGFDAFTRDYALLTDRTAPTPWKLTMAEGHILFPGSDAIETLAIFTR